MVTINSKYKLGEVVISTAGRDAGKCFTIVKIINENFVKVADGDLRRIEKPKFKNIKHLKPTGYIFEELAFWLRGNKRVRNHDIKALFDDYEENKEAK